MQASTHVGAVATAGLELKMPGVLQGQPASESLVCSQLQKGCQSNSLRAESQHITIVRRIESLQRPHCLPNIRSLRSTRVTLSTQYSLLLCPYEKAPSEPRRSWTHKGLVTEKARLAERAEEHLPRPAESPALFAVFGVIAKIASTFYNRRHIRLGTRNSRQ